MRTDATAATRATDSLGNSSDTMAKKMRVNSDQMARALKKASESGRTDIDKLKRSIEVLDKLRANPKIDLDTAAATAKLTILKRELRTLETRQARGELEALGLVASKTAMAIGGGSGSSAIPGVGGGGGGGPGAPGGLAGSMASAAGSAGMMTAAVVIAAPAVVTLGGAVSALVGSLGMAAGGAGVLGGGVMGAAAVGLGSIAAAAIPASKRIGEAKKAQDDYNKAVQQYGDASAQAVKAHETLLKAYEKGPGTRRLLANASALGTNWTRLSRPAQNDFIGLLNDGLATANKLLPQFAQISNNSMGSTRRALDRLFGRIESREAQGALRIMGQTFSQSITPFVNGIGNLASFFGRIARFANPTVVKVFEGFDRLTARWSRSAGSVGGQTTMGAMLSQLGAWVDLLKAAGGLAVTFFSGGQRQGKGLVEEITGQLERWTDWLKDNPGKVEKFFDDTVDAAKDLAGALATIATTLFQISDALIPVMQGASQVTSGLGPNALGALALYGGYRFAKGKMPGAAARGGSSVGAAVSGAVASTATARGDAGAAIRGAGAAGVAKGVGGGLLRKAGPIAVAMGLYDFATSEGGFGSRVAGAANGLLFGVPNALGAGWGTDPVPMSADQRAGQYLNHPGHQNVGSIQNQMARLRSRRDATSMNVDPSTGRVISVTPVLSRSGKRDLQKEIDALKPVLKVAVKADAGARTDDLVGAYNTRREGAGEGSARHGLFEGLGRQLGKVGKDGKRQLLTNMAEWSAVLEDGNAKQRNTADKLASFIERRFKRMGEDVQVVNGKILTGSQKEWHNIRRALTSEAERAAQEVSKAFTDIQREAAGSLMSMGYSRSEANALIRAEESGGQSGMRKVQAGFSAQRGDTGATRAAAPTTTMTSPVRPALGARIPGQGNADYVKLMGNAVGAPGELVVNRHSEHRADMKLGYPGALASIVGGENTPHGVMVSRHAMGGRSGDMASAGARAGAGSAGGGGGSAGSDLKGSGPEFAPVMSKLRSMFGNQLYVLSGSRPNSRVAGSGRLSNHSGGHAIDISWPGLESADPGRPPESLDPVGARALDQAYAYLQTIPKPPRRDLLWRTMTGGNHFNHVHFGMDPTGVGNMPGGLGNAPGLGGVSLKQRTAKARGVPGALAQRAIDAMVAGAQGRVGGGGAIGAGAAGGDASALRQRFGLPSVFDAIRQAESGGNANALNASGASGYYQIMMPLHQALVSQAAKANNRPANVFDPVVNTAVARMLYDQSGTSPWVSSQGAWGRSANALGGRLPGVLRMGDGGSFTTGGLPQLMQVGERGQREHVKVTRESAGTALGSDGSISIKVGRIDYRNDGDIEKKVVEEFKKAARAIRNLPIDGSEL